MTHERNRSIDMFKAILVIGMILCHCIMLLKVYGVKSYILTEYFNVITFSGFLFCFGYAVGIAYLPKNKKYVSKKLARNCLKTLVAFYISGLGYQFLIQKDFSLISISKLVILDLMPGYSEFLAGFFVLNLLTLIFFNQLKRIVKSKMTVLGIIFLSLISTQIPYDHVPTLQIGLLIGSTKFSSFPIIQYLGYYLLGMYFQQYKVKFNYKFVIVSILCSIIFLQYVIANHIPPTRFPPSLRWIIGASGVLYGYYSISIWLSKKIKSNNCIYLIGEKTLYFLVISNLMIFTFRGIFNFQVNTTQTFFLFIAILVLCYLVSHFVSLAQNMYKKRI